MLKHTTMRLALAAVATLAVAGCTLGTPMYDPPPKNFPTMVTFNKGMNDVWDASYKALVDLGYEVTSKDKASGKIETSWTDTGHAPARKCTYGVNSYWENPKRRQQLAIVVKKVPGASAPAAPAAPAFPGAAPGFGAAAPGGFPGAAPAGVAPGFPGAAAPAAAPGFPGAVPGGFPGAAAPAAGFPGAAAPAAGFPGAAPARPAAPAGGGRTMVIVVSKGESVLPEDCGDEPGTIEIANTDTVTEYRFLHAVGQSVGHQMEAPPAQ